MNVRKAFDNPLARVFLLLVVLSSFAVVTTAAKAQLKRSYPIVRSVEINFDTTDIATGIKLFTLPKTGHILSVKGVVDTAWNSSVSDTLEIGWAADPDGYTVGGKDLQVLGSITGVETVIAEPGAASRDVILKVTGSGTAATAGKAHVFVTFVGN